MKRSAGLLLYRRRAATLEFFLVHPGGPYWAKKDAGAWSIPKGLYVEGEEPLVAAKREFAEETGLSVDGDFVALGEFRQPSGKVITAWMVEADCDAGAVMSNLFAMEWPPKSGNTAEFPEVDRAWWFAPEEAVVKILRGQKPILEAALQILRSS
ncbi:MAG TPA: NUDIX domain-containing protein [Rhizomicrobium sp.]|jgi:predicted NUDIX family NTP pyrophosphohydrolase